MFFGNHKPDYDYSKVHFGGWLNKTELLLELSKGGFGLVWGNQENPKDEPDYYKMNCSYKLASYLSAGIPVIVPDYLSNADFVKKIMLVLLFQVWKKLIKSFKNVVKKNIVRWYLV